MRVLAQSRQKIMRMPARILVLFAIAAGAVFGSVTDCYPSSNNTLQNVDGTASSGSPSPNPNGGCAVVDKNFYNFTASGGATNGTQGNPGLADIAFTNETAPSFSGTSLTGLNVQFSTVTANNWSTTGGAGSDFNYLGAVVQAIAPAPVAPYTNWALDSFNLSYSNINFSTGNQALVLTESVCLGGNSVPANGSTAALPCSTSNLAQISILATYNGSSVNLSDTCTVGGVAVTCGGTLSNPKISGLAEVFNPTTFSVQTNVFLIGNGQLLTLGNLIEGFDQTEATPEPATVGLIGFGVIALFAARSRFKVSS